ncbi:MAG: hypothetical protein ABFE08_17740 [Armatimonadia bacterium]
MPTVTPSIVTTTGVPCVTWAGMITGDTINAFTMREQWGLAGSVQISGTFGGATVKLQHSNDGTNWFDAVDIRGTAVSATTAAIFEVTISSVYFRATVTGGSANSINMIVALRGLY